MKPGRSMRHLQKTLGKQQEQGLLRAALLLLLMLLVLAQPCAEAKEALKVGYVPGTGFLEEDRPGHQRGSGYDYMEFLAQYGGWQFEYVPCADWWEAGEKLSSGEIDLLPAMPGNYRTLPQAVRTDHVIARFPMELVVQDDFSSAAPLKLGTLTYNYPIPGLPEAATSYGLSYELINFRNQTELEQAFEQRSIDGYVDPLLHPDKKHKVLALFDRVSYRLLVHKDRPDLLARVNSAQDALLLYQPNIRNWLNDKYNRAKGFPLVLTAEEQKYLQERPQLKAAVLTRSRPYLYRDEDGTYHGAIHELITQMEKDLNVDIELVEEDSLEGIQRLVTRGTLDFVVDVPCDPSWLHGLGIVPTQPYMSRYYVLVERRDAQPKTAPKAAVWRDAFSSQNFVIPLYSQEQIVYCKSWEECLQAVSNGRADLTFAPRSMVPHLMESASVYNLEADTESHYTEDISLGVSNQADPRLWHILNKEVNHLPPGLIADALSKTAREHTYRLDPQWLIYHYPLQAALLVFLIMGVIAGIIYYRSYMRRRHLRAIQHMAYTDMRYQLPNLLWLEQELPRLLEKARTEKPGERLYLAVFDMSSKSSMIELYGRHLLDRKLKDTAEALMEQDWVLQSVAGVNGGQFVCLCTAPDDQAAVAQASQAITEHGWLMQRGSRVSLHMRAGLCELQEDGHLLAAEERADTACQELLGSVDTVMIYNEEMEERLQLEQRIESSMEKALAGGEFMAWYQPKYDLASHRLVGAEALVRWQSKEMGFMPPGRFIPALEMNGFVIPVDDFILECAMRLQRRRLDKGQPIVPISVNQSRLHLTEEGYTEKMQTLMDRYQLPQGAIELEITETMFGDFDEKDYREHTAFIMSELHRMGFSLSLDDFGSGYSSFAMLDALPLDGMKIDRSLLIAATNSEGMRKVLKSIVSMGDALGLKVICEGVETDEQEQLLLAAGCRYGQGYRCSKPVPEQEFLAMLAVGHA